MKCLWFEWTYTSKVNYHLIGISESLSNHDGDAKKTVLNLLSLSSRCEISWNQILMLRISPLDYEQSLFFSWSVEQNARDTQMITRVTKGARRERHEPPSFLASRVSRLCHSKIARACTPLTKSDEKERLLAVYSLRSKEEMRHCWANNFDRCCVHSHVAKRLTGFKLWATGCANGRV